MKSSAISKEEFIERAIDHLGEEVVFRQLHTVEPCACTNEYCTGWRIQAEEPIPLILVDPKEA